MSNGSDARNLRGETRLERLALFGDRFLETRRFEVRLEVLDLVLAMVFVTSLLKKK